MVDYLDLESYVVWPGFFGGSLSTAELDRTLDADGEMVGYIVRAPKAGTIDQVVFHTGTVTQDPANGVKWSFQGVNPATGKPDGVVSHHRTKASLASDTSYETGLITDDGTDIGNKKTVTAGELFSIIVEFDTFQASDKLEIRDGNSTIYSSFGHEGAAIHLKTGGVWATAHGGIARILLKYSDGTYVPLTRHMGAGAKNTESSVQVLIDVNTTPDEVGVKFTAPYNCRLKGLPFYAGIRSEETNIVLYNASDTALATLIYGTDWCTINATNTMWLYNVHFPTNPELTEGDVYRLVFKPTTDTGAGLLLKCFEYENASYANAISDAYIKTERTNGGAWTDTDTRRMAMTLLLSHVEAAGGGAGVPQSLHPIEAGITA